MDKNKGIGIMMEVNSRRFISNIGWLIGGKITNMVLQFIVSLATARYLGPSNFGKINYVGAYVAFFSSIASLGLNVIVIKEISLGKETDNEIIWTSIWMRFGIAILSTISLISIIFMISQGDKLLIGIAILQSISIIFSSFDTINYWFQAKLMSKYSSIAGVLSYLSMSLYRIYLLVNKSDLIWFAFAISTEMIFLTLFLTIFYIKENGFNPCFNWGIGKKLLGQSYPYLIAGLVTILYTQVDRVMLGTMLDSTSVGLYSSALTISALWSMIPTALIQSISPVLYDSAKKSKEIFLRRLRQSYAIIFLLNTIYSIIITLFAKFFILFLYGDDYLDAKKSLIIVVWYYGISTMSMISQIYLANFNKNKYIYKFCIAGLVSNIILNICLIPNYGIEGAAFATLITQIIIQFIMPLIYYDTREIAYTILKACMFIDIINKNELLEIKKLILNIKNKFKRMFYRNN